MKRIIIKIKKNLNERKLGYTRKKIKETIIIIQISIIANLLNKTFFFFISRRISNKNKDAGTAPTSF